MVDMKKVCAVGTLALVSSCVMAGSWFGSSDTKASKQVTKEITKVMNSQMYVMAKTNPTAYRVMVDQKIIGLLTVIAQTEGAQEQRARNENSVAGEWEQEAIDQAHNR